MRWSAAIVASNCSCSAVSSGAGRSSVGADISFPSGCDSSHLLTARSVISVPDAGPPHKSWPEVATGGLDRAWLERVDYLTIRSVFGARPVRRPSGDDAQDHGG